MGSRKTVFLLPYRALVNEKYEDFAATYRQVGLRVIRCSGDFTDEAGLFLSGRYDIAFLTFEMFLSLGVATPHVLKRLGLVVLDEAQFITDPTRGISVELLLTLLLAARSQGVHPQLIALSAVIGDINKFDEWLGSKRLVWTKRPMPLIEGVLDRKASISRSMRTAGKRRPRCCRHAIHQRKDEPSSQDVIVPLVRSLVSAGRESACFPEYTRSSARMRRLSQQGAWAAARCRRYCGLVLPRSFRKRGTTARMPLRRDSVSQFQSDEGRTGYRRTAFP